jgi:hypothetical protein
LRGWRGPGPSPGAGLAATLTDLAALHAVLAEPESGDRSVAPDVDATPATLLRLAAVAWADVATDRLANTEVTDPMTGLPTAALFAHEAFRGLPAGGAPRASGPPTNIYCW